MIRLLSYPAFFAAGWLFNFVFDVRFAAGFASGWLAHTWLGPILDLAMKWLN
jgi:hypothetical protein